MFLLQFTWLRFCRFEKWQKQKPAYNRLQKKQNNPTVFFCCKREEVVSTFGNAGRWHYARSHSRGLCLPLHLEGSQQAFERFLMTKWNITARCHVWIVNLCCRWSQSPVRALQTAAGGRSGCARREMHALAETVDFRDAQPPVRWSRGFIGCPTCELNANWPAWNVCEVEEVVERFLFPPLRGAYFTVVWNKSLALWVVQVCSVLIRPWLASAGSCFPALGFCNGLPWLFFF